MQHYIYIYIYTIAIVKHCFDSNLKGFILLICFVWDFLPTFNLIVLVLIL